MWIRRQTYERDQRLIVDLCAQNVRLRAQARDDKCCQVRSTNTTESTAAHVEKGRAS